MAGGNKGFGSALTAGFDKIEEQVPSQTAAVMESRSDSLARIASGNVVRDRTEFIDPARCRPWSHHNRDLDHLNQEACQSLIDGFLAARKQRIPAIVRRLENDPEHEFEIIAGVRRWWTVQWLRSNGYPEFDYLVTIQSFKTDEEAFRVSDVENRSRKDISDWERSKDYGRALVDFYDGNQSRMADALSMPKPTLSQLLAIARLPDFVVAAFADTHEITNNLCRQLSPLLKDEAAAHLIEAEAVRISAEQAAARAAGEATLPAIAVAKRLVSATRHKEAKAEFETLKIHASSGKAMLTVKGEASGGLTLKILPDSGATEKELIAAILDAVKKR